MTETIHKRCTKCRELKPRAAYHKGNNRSDGLQAACRSCDRERKRQWNLTNVERERARKRRWEATHPGARAAREARRRASKRGSCASCYNRAAIAELHHEATLAAAFSDEPFNVDHIVPLARGGKHHQNNLRILPARLNALKGSKLDSEVQSHEFHEWLGQEPSYEQVTWRTFHPKLLPRTTAL